MVGATISSSDLSIFLNRKRPTALVVNCTTPCGLPGAARMIEAAHDVGIPTMVGGAGFGVDNASAIRLGAAGWASDVDAGVAILREWTTSPPSLTPSGAINEDYTAFVDALADIQVGAMATLRRSKFRRREDAVEMASAHEGLDLLLHYLEAALLVDDQRVLLEYLTWMTAYSRDHAASTSRLTSFLEAVATEIPLTSPRAGRFVQDALRHLDWSSRSGSRRLAPSPRTPALSRPEAPAPATVAPEVQQGQVFDDLLFLAAVSCHAPMALISVLQPDRLWSTLSYGVDRREALNEPALFAAVAESPVPIELPDLAADPSRRASSLATGPLAVRFVYGHPLRSGVDGTALGVFCVMDRRVRQLSGAEHQAMSAIARQVTDQIVLWRRTTASKPEPILTGPRRRSTDRIGGSRPGPDAALVELIGLRRPGSGVEQHLLRSHEVAVLFDVTERTVINWASSKKLPSLRTAGGHLRFRSEDVVALLAGRTTSPVS
jgi:excisionase family DNA binding protein